MNGKSSAKIAVAAVYAQAIEISIRTSSISLEEAKKKTEEMSI